MWLNGLCCGGGLCGIGDVLKDHHHQQQHQHEEEGGPGDCGLAAALRGCPGGRCSTCTVMGCTPSILSNSSGGSTSNGQQNRKDSGGIYGGVPASAAVTTTTTTSAATTGNVGIEGSKSVCGGGGGESNGANNNNKLATLASPKKMLGPSSHLGGVPSKATGGASGGREKVIFWILMV